MRLFKIIFIPAVILFFLIVTAKPAQAQDIQCQRNYGTGGVDPCTYTSSFQGCNSGYQPPCYENYPGEDCCYINYTTTGQCGTISCIAAQPSPTPTAGPSPTPVVDARCDPYYGVWCNSNDACDKDSYCDMSSMDPQKPDGCVGKCINNSGKPITPVVNAPPYNVCQSAGGARGACEICMYGQKIIAGSTVPSQANPKVWTALGCVDTSPTAFFTKLLAVGTGIAGGIALLLILLGGFQIMTASGNPEQMNAGRELIGAAITGLILIIFSVLILRILGVDLLGIPGFS